MRVHNVATWRILWIDLCIVATMRAVAFITAANCLPSNYPKGSPRTCQPPGSRLCCRFTRLHPTELLRRTGKPAVAKLDKTRRRQRTRPPTRHCERLNDERDPTSNEQLARFIYRQPATFCSDRGKNRQMTRNFFDESNYTEM